MNSRDLYLSLPKDLSGSRSKNRFRLELLWGLGKLIELMETDDDFTIVFDYVCDIEVHFANGYGFFQIKTHSSSKNSYTIKELTRKEPTSEGSILGKLFALKIKDKEGTIKVAVVSNLPLSIESKKSEQLEIYLDTLPDETQLEIQNAICKELAISSIDLTNVFYIRSHMNFAEPQNELVGKLCFCFEKLTGHEPSRPNTLYRLIESTIADKACYEYTSEEYDQLVRKKGITRTEFEEMLDQQSKDEVTGIEGAKKYINEIKNLQERRIYLQAMGKLVTILHSSRPLQNIEKSIAKKVMEINPESIDEAVGELIETCHSLFPPEITNAEKMVMYFIVIHKYVEGGYDDELAI